MPEQPTENLPPQTHSTQDHMPPAVTHVPSDLVFACLIVIWIGAGWWQLLRAPMNFNQRTLPQILRSTNCSGGMDLSDVIFHFQTMSEVSLARGRRNFLTGKLINSSPSFNADQFSTAIQSCQRVADARGLGRVSRRSRAGKTTNRVWPMGLMERRVGCLQATSPNRNMRDQEVLWTVASEVLSEDRAPVCAVARAAIATCCRGRGADRRRRDRSRASSS